MAMTIHTDIVSADYEIFSGLAELVVVTGSQGEIGIKPGHAPLLTSLKPGQIRVVKQGGEEELFYVAGGHLEVQPHIVTILASTASRARDLDEAEAIEAKQRAEALLAGKQGEFEYAEAAADLARAVAKIQAIRKLRKQLR